MKTERVSFDIKPPRFVRYKNQSYSFRSFDVGRVVFTRDDGTHAIDFDDDDVYCTLVDEMTGKGVRVHLQDKDMEF